MELHHPKYYWLRLNLRHRFLLCFLALSFIIFAVLSSVTISGMKNIDSFVGNTVSKFGLRAASATGDALENVGKQQLKDKSLNCARETSAYLVQHQGIPPEQFYLDSALSGIAVQRFGNTGYTFIYEETQLCKFESAIIRLHPDPRFINAKINDLLDDQLILQSINFDDNFMGIYYYWRGLDGSLTYKFAYMRPMDQTDYIVPMDVTAYNKQFGESRNMVFTTIDVSELRALSQDIQAQITSDSLDVKNYIQQQYDSMQNYMVLAFLITLCLSTGLAFWVAKTVTKPISALTESSKILAKGNFEHRVDVKAGGEFDELASQFNLMAAELKDSYADLERKVEERTRNEHRKTEHLQSINEIGQKISSILNVEDLFPFVVNSLNLTFHYNVHIFLIDTKSNSILLKYGVREYDRPVPIGLRVEETEGLVSYAARIKKPMLSNNITDEGQPGFRKNSKTKSEIAVPIAAGGQLLGIINIESEQPNAFDEVDLFTVKKVADQLAIALINAKLYQQKHHAGVMEERNRLAREIHDNLAQGFIGIILQLEGADQVLYSDLSKVQEHLNKAKELARESLNEARRSVRALRPQTLEKYSLVQGFHLEVRNFIRDTGIETQLNINGERESLNPEMENALYLILRESLINIRKHAQASLVEVNLNVGIKEVELDIKDNGQGFTFEDIKDQSFGLTSMKERAGLLGGSLKVITERGKGTLITVKLPLNEEEHNG
jgi:signal transduction histidine kinase